MKNEEIWSRLLYIIDRLNRSVKESGWYPEDKTAVYCLKDNVIGKILREKPQCMEISMFYVPYYHYCGISKDKAGELMRKSSDKQPFEYYLAQIEPCEYDVEVPEKATVMVNISCMEQQYSFHMPVNIVSECGVDISGLPKSVWINSRDFHHQQYIKESEAAENLLKELN